MKIFVLLDHWDLDVTSFYKGNLSCTQKVKRSQNFCFTGSLGPGCGGHCSREIYHVHEMSNEVRGDEGRVNKE